ncbi:MAG: hypothetical protein Q9182_004675 [Xanthomendoza sp. 2 TL-2023]
MAALKGRIRHHYELASEYYFSLWGEHIHHGYFLTPSDTKERAQLRLIELLIDRSQLESCSAVLDVGCGIGGTSRYLARNHGCKVTGITISGKQVGMATKLTCDAGINTQNPTTTDSVEHGYGSAHFHEVDAETMADFFPEQGVFDCIWISEALSHLPDKPLFFRNAFKVLRPPHNDTKLPGKLVVADWFKAEDLTEKQLEDDIRPIEDGMLLPPLCTQSEYQIYAKEAGLSIFCEPLDISKDVAKTCEFCKIIPMWHKKSTPSRLGTVPSSALPARPPHLAAPTASLVVDFLSWFVLEANYDTQKDLHLYLSTMKLIVAGASGYVATEIIRQSLSISKITSVIALARAPVPVPSNLDPSADASKLHGVVIESYNFYPDDVKAQLAGADACIWTVAITPNKAWGMDFAEVRRVCHDYALIGLENIMAAQVQGRMDRSTEPLCFLYMSGAGAERDPGQRPTFDARYLLLRGETENRILAFTAENQGKVEACVAKPGFITESGRYLRTFLAMIFYHVFSLPRIDLEECARAILHQVLQGFSKETLENEDLIKIGRQKINSEGW